MFSKKNKKKQIKTKKKVYTLIIHFFKNFEA